jgi:hypothetical protein
VNAPIEIGDVNGTPALSIASDGRLNMQRIGQTSAVTAWPPAAMTGYVTTINGGTYVASASGDTSGNPVWTLFDKGAGYWYTGDGSAYSTSVPYYYIGSKTTSAVNGTVYKGDWAQIQLPTPITLSSYSFSGLASATNPSAWVILGSRDGVNWTLVNSQGTLALVNTTTYTYTVPTPSQTYNYFRLVALATGVSGYLQLTEWTLYGTADTQQPLEIAQPTTMTYPLIAPQLTGPQSAGVYVPQDFSSSALNIPAYVVSNTATVANTVAYSSMGPFAGEGSLYLPGGTGAYVNFGQPTQLAYNWTTADFTLECFIYPTTTAVNQNIFARDFEQVMFISASDSKLYYFITGVGSSSGSGNFVGPVITRNQWSHLAVSWSQSAQTMYLCVNGTVLSVTLTSGTPTYAGTRNMVMGMWQGSTAYPLNANISNLRFTRGAALYTTSSFTPPTGPLQPIQGVTQAGLPYGTVLLLRNAPAPGRVLTQKFAGANSGQVLAFPPAPMTGYATTLNAGYGQGVYVASASSEFPTPATGYPYAWYVFDKTTTNYFVTNAPLYGSSSPYAYTGTVTTVDITGTSYAGEWLQIHKPVSTIISSYIITCNGIAAAPQRFVVLGSRDGVNWFLLDSRSGVTWTTTGQSLTFSTQVSQSYIYYRIVTMNLQGNGTYIQMQELVFNGTIESVNVTPDGRVGLGVVNPTRALEVAGDLVVSGTVSSQSTTFRNVLYNGDFRINQRGISTTVGSPSAMGTTAAAYAVDRWLCFRGAYAAGGTVAQGTMTSVDLPYQNDGLVNFMRIGRSVSDTSLQSIYVADVLETRDSIRLAGKIVTMSFYYRTGAAFAGTLQAVVATSTGTDQNYTANWAGPVYQVNSLPSSTAWTKYSFSAQVPINSTQVAAPFWYIPTTNPAVANDYFDITGVQLEKGTVATPFEVRPFATELALCQRYYEQSYSMGVTAGVNTNIGMNTFHGVSDNSNNMSGLVRYSVPKRVSPTPVIYAPAGAINKMASNKSGALNVEADAISTYRNEFSFMGYCSIATGFTPATINFHWTASAEL